MGNIKQCKNIGTLDVEALYPSIKTDLVLIAVGHALKKMLRLRRSVNGYDFGLNQLLPKKFGGTL